MSIPQLSTTESKTHWYYSDNFGLGDFEYIKSFTHYDYSIGYHTHSFFELNVVINGEGYHYIEKMSYLAKTGCVFLIPPYVKHGYLSTNNLNVYHMLIHKDFLTYCFNEFKQTEGYYLLFEIEPHLRANYTRNTFLSLDCNELGILKQDIEIIEKCKSIQNSNIFVNAIAKKILCHLCLLMYKKYSVVDNEYGSNSELLTIIDCLNYIHQNYDEKLTVSQLSEKLHMSRSTFIRYFTKTCGCSPHQYIQQYRIKKAKELIKNTDKTASSIAQECGFYDVSHMRKYLNLKNK